MTAFRRLPVALAGLALMPGAAHALPLVDIEVGARYWQADPSGNFSYKGDDLKAANDLDFGKEWAPNAYARAALPFITIDAEYTSLSYEGKVQSTVSASTQWGSGTVSQGGDAALDAKLLHGGVMFNVPLPVIDVGLGIGGTQIDAEAEIETDAGKQTANGKGTLPVAKGEVRVNLPAIPLNASVRANGIGYQGNKFSDITAELGYEMGLLQIKAGYRQIAINFENDDFQVDSDFSGPFAGLHLAF